MVCIVICCGSATTGMGPAKEIAKREKEFWDMALMILEGGFGEAELR